MVFLRYFEKFGGYLARPIPGNLKNSYLTVWTLGNAIFHQDYYITSGETSQVPHSPHSAHQDYYTTSGETSQVHPTCQLSPLML